MEAPDSNTSRVSINKGNRNSMLLVMSPFEFPPAGAIGERGRERETWTEECECSRVPHTAGAAGPLTTHC